MSTHLVTKGESNQRGLRTRRQDGAERYQQLREDWNMSTPRGKERKPDQQGRYIDPRTACKRRGGGGYFANGCRSTIMKKFLFEVRTLRPTHKIELFVLPELVDEIVIDVEYLAKAGA